MVVPGASGTPGGVRRDHGVDDVGADRLPRSAAVTTPSSASSATSTGRSGCCSSASALFLAGCLGAAFAWNIWSLIAFRVVSGRGRRALPAQLRDHPRRVPAGEGRGRDRPALGRVRRRRRLGHRALRRDRRQLLVALALHCSARSPSPSRSCSCTASCPSRRSSRRRASTFPAPRSSRAARLAAAGAHRGRAWGWTRRASRLLVARGRASSLWELSSCARARRWSTCGCSRTGPCCSRTSRR